MTKPPPNRPPKKRGGSAEKYDWNAVRGAYVYGGDSVTYQTLSASENGPGIDAIKKRATREKWGDLRAQFRHILARNEAQMQLEAAAVVRHRQAEGGKRFQAVGLAALELIEPGTLTPSEIARFFAVGAEIERQAYLMPLELTVNLDGIESPADLRALTVEQLLELKRQRRAAFGPGRN